MQKRWKTTGLIATTVMLITMAFTATPAKAESHFSFGIGLGPSYYAPPPVVYRPPYPGPGYYWTDGYYNPYGVWVGGFWAPRAYVRPYGYGYVAPRYYGGYYGGYRRDFDRREFRGDRDYGRRR